MMSSNGKSESESDIASLIFRLCRHITKQPDEEVETRYRFLLNSLASSPLTYESDEFVTVEKLKKKMVKNGRPKDALTYADLYRKLQSSMALRNRSSVLTLLYNLYDTHGHHNYSTMKFTNELTQIRVPEMSLHAKDFITSKTFPTKNAVFQIVKKENELENLQARYQAELDELMDEKQNNVTQMAAMFAKKADMDKAFSAWTSMKYDQRSNSNDLKDFLKADGDKNFNIKLQKNLLRDIIYAVQGISGKDIQWVDEKGHFNAVIHDSVGHSTKRLALRFCEMGWMFTKIDSFCKLAQTDKKLGLIGQSFVAALEEELREFYRMLAILQTQLQQVENEALDPKDEPLTLHRLSVWFMDSYRQFQFLASLVDSITDEKGGKITSILHAHMQHGNKSISDMMKRLLMAAIQPLYTMIINWIFCGELNDSFEEFFIVNSMREQKNMWHEKYSLNNAMIPSFLSITRAKKVLSIGKAINFLREVCMSHSFAGDKEILKKRQDTKIMESLFIQTAESEFHKILDEGYKKTSKLVLEVLLNDHKLMCHFQAMRSFLLLGQGDFIRHIMDLLEPDLAKPANTLHKHILSGTLESAIQATNAQFYEPEVLQRLTIKLMESSAGETGWNIFSLSYNVAGPINTVFTDDCMLEYSRLFKYLWNAKRLEYMLASICQDRSEYLKYEEHIPEVAPVTFKCNIILAQMVHFLQQIQYYNAFEVMECNWVDLLQKIEAAHDLDEIITAHSTFLKVLLTHSLLNQESKDLSNKLKDIFSLIINFNDIQAGFWSQVRTLIKLHNEQKQRAEIQSTAEKWATFSKETQVYENELRKLKTEGIPTTNTKLKLLVLECERTVQQFLLMLNNHVDDNLRFLSFRLDFNEHFKNQNNMLRTSLTYSYRRKSLRYS